MRLKGRRRFERRKLDSIAGSLHSTEGQVHCSFAVALGGPAQPVRRPEQRAFEGWWEASWRTSASRA